MSQSSPQPERRAPHRPMDAGPDARLGVAPSDVVPSDVVPSDAVPPSAAGPPGTSGTSGTPGIRASDAEREAVVERLRIASVEGRLTFEELTERTEAAYVAVGRDDLERITADLPGMGAPGADPAPVQVKRKFSAVMGDCKERISSRIDGPLEAVSVMGDVVVDLREAQVPSGEVSICATAVMGDVKIIVPDGVAVELSGWAVMGDRKVAVREARHGARVPVVRVNARAVMGDVKIIGDEHHAPVRRAIGDWWRGRSA